MNITREKRSKRKENRMSERIIALWGKGFFCAPGAAAKRGGRNSTPERYAFPSNKGKERREGNLRQRIVSIKGKCHFAV